VVELLRIRNTKKGCANESFKNIETPVCDCCGKPHRIVLEEHDSENLKESIRVIDSNRDYLLAKVEYLTNDLLVAWPEDHKRRERVKVGVREAKKAVGEMNDAVREICKENNIYQARKGKAYPPPPKH